MDTRALEPTDLPAIAQLASGQQKKPERHIVYVGVESDGIAAEIEEIEDWHRFGVAVVEGDSIVGWLLGEIDEELGRVWWIGPFVDGPWDVRIDTLYEAARATLPESITEEELAADTRHLELAAMAAPHGFEAQEGSAILVLDRELDVSVSDAVRPVSESDADRVWQIHDGAFPGTHLTRTLLERSDERNIRLVLEDDGVIAGYIVLEVQADGSGYIDYLAVAPEFQGRGHGRSLIEAGVAALSEAGAEGANLTVRETNMIARRLYTSIGFTEERVARPYRKGFTLD